VHADRDALDELLEDKDSDQNLHIIAPQDGFQKKALACEADIALWGGAGGVGKTFALAMEAYKPVMLGMQGVNVMVLRREFSDFEVPESVWGYCKDWAPIFGMHVKNDIKKLIKKGSKDTTISFRGIQHEQSIDKIQGGSIDVMLFDELTHFTEKQFWTLFARLRSVTGYVTTFVRMTCNPVWGSWVHRLFDWWIDPVSGYPIKEREGVIRWMVRDGDRLYWMSSKERADTFMQKKGLHQRSDGLKIHAQSVTFIPGRLEENQILLKKNPFYASRLAGMTKAEKDALLDGRWVKATEGKIFKESWFKHMVVPPAQKDVILVTTDTASSTREGKGSDPDYTVFQVWTRSEGKIYLLYQSRGRLTGSESITRLANVILTYGAKYVSIERAAMGFSLIDQIVKRTSVIVIEIVRSGKKGNSKSRSKGTNMVTYGNKHERAEAIQAYVEQGYVYLDPNASYYLELMDEIKGFSPSSTDHDDQVDCLVDAVTLLIASKKLGYGMGDIKLKAQYKPGYNMV